MESISGNGGSGAYGERPCVTSHALDVGSAVELGDIDLNRLKLLPPLPPPFMVALPPPPLLKGAVDMLPEDANELTVVFTAPAPPLTLVHSLSTESKSESFMDGMNGFM